MPHEVQWGVWTMHVGQNLWRLSDDPLSLGRRWSLQSLAPQCFMEQQAWIRTCFLVWWAPNVVICR